MKIAKRIACTIPSLREKYDKNPKKDIILEDLQLVKEQLVQTRMEFDRHTNLDLIESCIYQIESLEVRYNYLIKQARLAGISQNELLDFVG